MSTMTSKIISIFFVSIVKQHPKFFYLYYIFVGIMFKVYDKKRYEKSLFWILFPFNICLTYEDFIGN